MTEYDVIVCGGGPSGATTAFYAAEAGMKVLVIDKSTGDICLTPVHSMEMINADKRIKHLKQMVADSKPPDRCYDPVPDGKSGNYKHAIGCIYCSHKRECWKDINDGKGIRVFEYAKGKRYLVQVRKEPDVLEVVNW